MALVDIDTLLGEVSATCREAPMLTMRSAYLRAARELCDKSHWLLRSTSALATVIDQQVSTLELDDPYADAEDVLGIRAMSVIVGALDVRALTDIDSGEIDPNDTSVSTDGVPEFYQYLPTDQFALFGTPSAVYSMHATLIVQPKRTATSIDEHLVNAWDRALTAGTLHFMLNLPRCPWTDKQQAEQNRLYFVGQCNQAHMSALRAYNAGARLTDRDASQSGALRTRTLPI